MRLTAQVAYHKDSCHSEETAFVFAAYGYKTTEGKVWSDKFTQSAGTPWENAL
jgi:hypothetical protein